jgi:hypothetical protein
MRDAALSSVDPRSLGRGYRAQGRTEPPTLGLDGGRGYRPTRLRNMVRASTKGSWEQRDTSQREHGNAPRCDTDPNNGGDGDEHDDRDDY